MTRRTLREYLSIPNPELAILEDAPAPTITRSEVWEDVREWRLWNEFAEDFERIFGELLDRQYELADPPPLPDVQSYIRDERSFEFVLTRWNNVIVNEALRAVCQAKGLDLVTWTVGTSVIECGGTEDIIRPDWAAVTPAMFSKGSEKVSLVPGDTKFEKEKTEDANLSAPAQPYSSQKVFDSDGCEVSSLPDQESALKNSWFGQVSYYAYRYRSRYCYVISNQNLLLLRRTEDFNLPPSASMAVTRARRQIHKPDDTPASSPNPQLVVISSSPPLPSSPFTEDYVDRLGDPNVNIEMYSIPWTRGDMTVNQGIFAIHLLGLLSNNVASQYPRLSEDPSYKTLYPATSRD